MNSAHPLGMQPLLERVLAQREILKAGATGPIWGGVTGMADYQRGRITLRNRRQPFGMVDDCLAIRKLVLR